MALGERDSKLIGSTATHYDYDEGSHLLAESTSGSPSRDYLWLGDLPIGVIDTTGTGTDSTSVVSSVYADAQGTPRIIADANNNLVWLQTASTDRFGWAAPFIGTYNLRYPGQYFDQETGLYYNLNRNYDPATGRYIQSDPIGLDGGMNTYLYVSGNPLSLVDALGLKDYRDKCVGRYSSCAATQDPNRSTFGNWLMFKGCKATFDWGIREGETAGTKIACDAERRECTANLTWGELDESDPLAIKCNNEFRKCMMSGGKGK